MQHINFRFAIYIQLALFFMDEYEPLMTVLSPSVRQQMLLPCELSYTIIIIVHEYINFACSVCESR